MRVWKLLQKLEDDTWPNQTLTLQNTVADSLTSVDKERNCGNERKKKRLINIAKKQKQRLQDAPVQ